MVIIYDLGEEFLNKPEILKIEDQNTAEKGTEHEDTLLSNKKSKFSYKSVPASYRQISLLNGFSNTVLQEHFGVNKPLLKEVGEEESIQELENYC